jgi:hypothetical protein
MKQKRANREYIQRNVPEVIQRTLEALDSPVLPHAQEMAQELITSIQDETEHWGLITAVWLEMIFYAAPHCRVRSTMSI